MEEEEGDAELPLNTSSSIEEALSSSSSLLLRCRAVLGALAQRRKEKEKTLPDAWSAGFDAHDLVFVLISIFV
eukprot:CAMPEP_0195016866 /NCGR_PEP_ID=MMETSP0326_2-20130528/25686_1 /TAXON_ID=2866 ORGANISM="Crypthecodinium cohnii, Strain Seligo" /NCGR_SAMPLE_ID=MMETSP0326_2 /ASSEMBLY_ACC=CAM_ASM_000348 /LENGTH=72 /DNA_ID=CAMNT_0040032891 /DNA_START=48 /DNA_END=264 /DNA_ORIENTATION=-